MRHRDLQVRPDLRGPGRRSGRVPRPDPGRAGLPLRVPRRHALQGQDRAHRDFIKCALEHDDLYFTYVIEPHDRPGRMPVTGVGEGGSGTDAKAEANRANYAVPRDRVRRVSRSTRHSESRADVLQPIDTPVGVSKS